MSASYLTITCRLPAGAEEDLASTLEHWPVLGCQVENAGADIAVTVFINENEAGALVSICEGLAALGGREIGSGHFAEQDWLAEYRRHAVPRPIGTLFWLDPHPEAPTPRLLGACASSSSPARRSAADRTSPRSSSS